MQDHWGVVTQEDDEEVGSITRKSDGEMTQVGVPENEISDELNTPWRDCVSREPKGASGTLRSQAKSLMYTRGQLGHREKSMVG